MLEYYVKIDQILFGNVLFLSHHSRIPIFHYSKPRQLARRCRDGQNPAQRSGVKTALSRTGLFYDSRLTNLMN